VIEPVHITPPDRQGDRRFHVADLTAQGELRLTSEYTYADLEQFAYTLDLIVTCATSIWRTPDELELALPASGGGRFGLRWRSSAQGAGILTLRSADTLSSVSLLAAGLSRDGDSLTLQTFQQHLVRELHDTGYEPAFSLLELPQRPLLATVMFQSPTQREDRLSIAVTDRCFAAAYFRYLGLV
jgi:hypothetical protein